MASEVLAAGLTLRPLRPGDEDTAVRWGADREFCLANGWSPGLAPRVLRRHWQAIIADRSPGFLRLGIEQGGELVGAVPVHPGQLLIGERQHRAGVSGACHAQHVGGAVEAAGGVLGAGAGLIRAACSGEGVIHPASV